MADAALTIPAPSRLVVDPVWAAITALSLVLVAMLAPMGLVLLALLGVIITVHEAGHFVAARRAGMQPVEFFWGFGPEIVAVEHRGTRYGLKALFVGGYVKLEGMTPSSSLPDGFPESGTYRAASNAGRLRTILAGPAVNLVCAVAAFTIAAWFEGAGLAGGVRSAFDDTWTIAAGTAEALWQFATGAGGYVQAVFDPAVEPPVRFLSPVAQTQVTEIAVQSGPIVLLRWFGVLSAAIGLVNLLPLPPLDGAHAAIVVADTVEERRRGVAHRFDVKRLEPLAYVTLAGLVLLSLGALVMDVRDVVG